MKIDTQLGDLFELEPIGAPKHAVFPFVIITKEDNRDQDTVQADDA